MPADPIQSAMTTTIPAQVVKPRLRLVGKDSPEVKDVTLENLHILHAPRNKDSRHISHSLLFSDLWSGLPHSN